MHLYCYNAYWLERELGQSLLFVEWKNELPSFLQGNHPGLSNMGFIVLMKTVQNAGDPSYTCFHCPWFYSSIMRSINILSAALVEAAAQAYWVLHAIWFNCLIIFNLGPYKVRPLMQYCSENPWTCYAFPVFMHFQYMQQFAGMQTPIFNKHHLYILVVNGHKLC